jgi:hypothetical protein
MIRVPAARKVIAAPCRFQSKMNRRPTISTYHSRRGGMKNARALYLSGSAAESVGCFGPKRRAKVRFSRHFRANKWGRQCEIELGGREMALPGETESGSAGEQPDEG